MFLRKFLASLFFSGLLAASATAGTCDTYLPQVRRCVEIQWEKPPVVNEDSPFVVKFWNPARSAYELPATGQVFLDLWMPDMRHGGPPVAVEQTGRGLLRASDVFFIMDGRWQVRVQIRNGSGSGIIEQVVFPISL